MSGFRWLSRRVAAPGPYLTLVLSQEEFDQALRHCRVREKVDFVLPGADASTHTLDNPKGEMCCIVALRSWQGRDPVEVAGMLVHEAVHVWQRHAANIGEKDPGIEQEAYAIQAISQDLMAEFARRMAGHKRRRSV